jgi:predicted nucleotidyltransferase
LEAWPTQPIAAWLFGSAPRAEADTGSDIDILVVRPNQLPDDETWQKQVDDLADQIRRWSGNRCETLVLTENSRPPSDGMIDW